MNEPVYYFFTPEDMWNRYQKGIVFWFDDEKIHE